MTYFTSYIRFPLNWSWSSLSYLLTSGLLIIQSMFSFVALYVILIEIRSDTPQCNNIQHPIVFKLNVIDIIFWIWYFTMQTQVRCVFLLVFFNVGGFWVNIEVCKLTHKVWCLLPLTNKYWLRRAGEESHMTVLMVYWLLVAPPGLGVCALTDQSQSQSQSRLLHHVTSSSGFLLHQPCGTGKYRRWSFWDVLLLK